MGRKRSQPVCPGCGKAAIIDDAGNIAFHTRTDGSYYCSVKPVGMPKVQRRSRPVAKNEQDVSRGASGTVSRAFPDPGSAALRHAVEVTTEVSKTTSTKVSSSAAQEVTPGRLVSICTRCGDMTKAGRTLCSACRRRIRAAGKALRGLSDSQPPSKKPRPPRGRVDPNRSWVLERARDALMAGFGVRRNSGGIKQLRSMVPSLLADFEASLVDAQRANLKTDLAARGFVGKNALNEFGQSVVTDIRRQREGSFRGISRGGLPGTRR